MMSDPICPFCGRDPFHYVDNGVGMEAVAVTCCNLGDMFFRGARPDPKTIEMSWEEFRNIGHRLLSTSASERGLREALVDLIEGVREVRVEGATIVLVCSSRLDAQGRILNARAALSPKGEDTQARATRSAPTHTSTKDTTNA